MAKLIGNAPNQVPTNADLGSMAFEDRTNYITKGASVYQPYRNLIINGDMSIAQRGTSASGITTGGTGTVHSVDRMALAISGAGTWTVSQETDVPSGQGFAKSLKFLCTTNQPSIGAGGYITFLQKFEGQNLQYLKYGTSNAENLTLSFWIKSSKTGNFIVELADRDNVKFNARLVSINSANTWEKKTVTFQGNTTNSFNNDNNWSMDLQIWFGTGTSFSSGTLQNTWQATQANRAAGLNLQLQDTTNANVYLTGVQLEAGKTASDFEFLPFDVNLQRCRRYFESNFVIGTSPAEGRFHTLAMTYSGLQAFAVNAARVMHFYKATKRATPTLTFYNVTGLGSGTSSGRWQIYDGGWSQATNPTVAGESRLDQISIQVEDSFSVGTSYLVGGGFKADAEL